MPYRRALSVLLLLAAAACQNEQSEPESERKTAAGEVLGGSVSDAMLPLDTVQSQNPLVGDAPAKEGAEDDSEGSAAGDARPTARASATAEASPTASATPSAGASAAPTDEAD